MERLEDAISAFGKILGKRGVKARRNMFVCGDSKENCRGARGTLGKAKGKVKARQKEESGF